MSVGVSEYISPRRSTKDLAERSALKLSAYHSRLDAALQDANLPAPIWPGLLLVFCRQTLSLSHLAEALQMPETSALRWIRYLDDRGLITRFRSSSTIVVSDQGRRTVEHILQSVA